MRISVSISKALFFLIFFSSVSVSQIIKLNGDMQDSGDIANSKVSLDGKYIVYLADQGSEGVNELYSVPIDRSQEPEKLNGPLVLGGGVGDSFNGTYFEISEDSQTVVYIADQNRNGTHELYSVNIDGSNRKTLNRPSINGSISITSFLMDRVSEKVIYRSRDNTNSVTELYSINFDGTGRTKLNGPLGSRGFVGLYQISEQTGRAVFIASDIASEDIFPRVGALYSNNYAGTDLVTLSSGNVTNENVEDILISNNERVVYSADQITTGLTELFVTGIRGGGVSRISAPGIVGSGNRVEDVVLNSPNELRVIYTVGRNFQAGQKLYSSHTNGDDTNYDLSPPESAFSSLGGANIRFVDVDSKFGDLITYTLQSSFTSNVYVTDAVGLSVTNITNAPVGTGASASKFTPQADSILLIVNDKVQECIPESGGLDRRRLIKYDLITGAVTNIFSQCGGGFISTDYVISKDSEYVVFTYEGLLVASTLSGNNIRVVTPFDFDSQKRVSSFGISDDNKYIWYVADQDDRNKSEIYSTLLKPLLDPSVDDICFPVKIKNGKVSLICL